MSGPSGLGVVWQVQEPFVRFKGVGGGFGWLMFDEVFGASMALYGFDFFALRGWGGV